MKTNIKRGIEKAIYLVAVLFVFIFGACTDQHIGEGIKTAPEPPIIKNDTTIVFDKDFKLHHEDWTISNGLAKADNYFDGYVNYIVNGDVVKSDLIDHQIAPMELIWTPMEETIGSSAERPYIGQKAGEAKATGTSKNQLVTLSTYDRECKLSFVGAELTIKGAWTMASLGKITQGCQFDSITVETQDVKDTVRVNGTKIEVVVDGNKYNRVMAVAKCLIHMTDINGAVKTPHSNPLDIVYPRLVPVSFTPGDKIYEGSTAIEGTGTYVKVTNESYKSSIKLTHYLTQDGNTLKEEEAVSGIASVKTWVEEKGQKMIVPTIKIGNPTVSVESTISEMYQKEGFIYAKKYTTVWTYTWSNGFTKKVYSEVERLFYRREVGKEVAMPYGETSTSFKDFIAGKDVVKPEDNQKYETYPEGMIYFNGEHKSETGNLKDAISGLQIGQEFWIVKEEPKDEKTGWDKEIIEGNSSKDAQIIITEHWSISGDKKIVFTQKASYTFNVVGPKDRVLGEKLEFDSGLSKSTSSTEYTQVAENQFARTVTTTYGAKMNLCTVNGVAGAIDAYIMYEGEKINFKFATANVEYVGLNNPTATEIVVNSNKYSRKAYEVTMRHSFVGEKYANVLVDKLIPMDPDMPDPWGPVDVEKTKQFGRLSWAWKNVNGTSVPFISATIITAYGVVSCWEGDYCFTQMATAEIKEKLGNSLCPESTNYLIPAYITIENKPNKHWVYSDINGKARDEVYGTLIEKLEDVTLDKPFFGEPSETSETYQIIDQDGSVRIKIVYNGTTLFDHVFKK